MVEPSRRRAIEDVASELFRAHGYAATSVRDIARALDIQGPSLYAHVTSKENVLWAIVERAAARFEAAADAATAVHGGGRHAAPDPGAALAALVRAHVRVITYDVGAAAVFVHEWRALADARRQAILARRDAYEGRFRDLIREGMAGGQFEMTDVALASATILGALNGLAAWYDPTGRLAPDRIADQMADLVLRMLQGASR